MKFGAKIGMSNKILLIDKKCRDGGCSVSVWQGN